MHNSRRRKKETGHSFERQMKNWLGGHRSISVICWKGHTACGIQEQPELWTLRPLGSFLSLSFIYLSASFPQLASFTWKLSNRSGSIHKEKCMKDTAKIMEEVCNDWNLETHGMSDMMLYMPLILIGFCDCVLCLTLSMTSLQVHWLIYGPYIKKVIVLRSYHILLQFLMKE